MPKDFTGQLIDGKYRVLRTIGSGTWGVVLECEHEELSRKVAVKVLHAQHITDPDSRQDSRWMDAWTSMRSD